MILDLDVFDTNELDYVIDHNMKEHNFSCDVAVCVSKGQYLSLIWLAKKYLNKKTNIPIYAWEKSGLCHFEEAGLVIKSEDGIRLRYESEIFRSKIKATENGKKGGRPKQKIAGGNHPLTKT